MGMFDYLKCKYPLPIPEMQDRIFQTKEFDCLMDTLEITPDGQLVMVELGYRQEWERGDFSDFHGDVHFYDFRRSLDTASGLVTFRARFTHGQVETISTAGAEGV